MGRLSGRILDVVMLFRRLVVAAIGSVGVLHDGLWSLLGKGFLSASPPSDWISSSADPETVAPIWSKSTSGWEAETLGDDARASYLPCAQVFRPRCRSCGEMSLVQARPERWSKTELVLARQYFFCIKIEANLSQIHSLAFS